MAKRKLPKEVYRKISETSVVKLAMMNFEN